MGENPWNGKKVVEEPGKARERKGRAVEEEIIKKMTWRREKIPKKNKGKTKKTEKGEMGKRN